MPEPQTLTPKEIARSLRVRKMSHHSTVLVLGSRAGGLFRSSDFFSIIADFGDHAGNSLSRLQSFAHGYQVLTGQQLSESEVYSIIRASLENVEVSSADRKLAQLVSQGYIDEIISANFDSLVEEAFNRVGMRAQRDFEVVVPGQGRLHPERLLPHRICKVFGSLSGEYSVERAAYFESSLAMKADKTVVESLLAKDILVVGLDPVWDMELLLAIPTKGNTIWFVNEENLLEHPSIARLLSSRNARYLVGKEGAYENFWETLSEQLNITEAPSGGVQPGASSTASTTQSEEQQRMQSEPPQAPITSTTPDVQQAEVMPPSQASRRKVFISYNRGDARYLDDFIVHLKPYIRNGSMEVWYDKKIESGEEWFKEIKQAIDETRIAVLLVSAGFLASDFIYKYELAPLLEAYEAGEVRLLPVVVSPCSFSDTPLSKLQAVNDPKVSLSRMKASDRDELWVRLVKNIKSVLGIKQSI